MKTKAKLLLAISTLSAVVLAAGVTSTFAWFTTKSTATFNTGTLTVSTLSKIKIKAHNIAPASGSITNNDSANVTGIAAPLGAVSSEFGKEFFAPTTLGGETFAEVGTSTAANKYTGFIKYNLMVYAEPDDGSNNLYLTVTVTAGTTVGDWYRVAVYTVTSSATDVITTAKQDPETGTNAFKYVFSKTAAASDAWRNASAPSTRATTAAGTRVQIPGFVTDEAGAEGAATKYRHLVVAVWMEGMASADQNEAGGETVSAKLDFELAKS